MKVIELSRQGCVTPHVVRFYVRKGLLFPGRHPHNGYRVFGRDDLARIGLIRALQALGFTLAEIGKALNEAEAGRSPMGWMRLLLEQHIETIDGELEALRDKRKRMRTALAQWERTDAMAPGHTDWWQELGERRSAE